MMVEYNIQRLVDMCRLRQEGIKRLDENHKTYLRLLRLKMDEKNIRRFEGKNGELVLLTPYAVRITPLESRKRQNYKR